MKKLLLILSLLSCTSYGSVVKKPNDYYILPTIYMEWNKDYPVDTWRASIKLDEDFHDEYGNTYTLTKYPKEDSIYILQIKLNLR
jgi:Na+-transporting NADH:ubiquinone oxidoreductase subunit NqrF